jgi:REP element-mobilizing transposase RayT
MSTALRAVAHPTSLSAARNMVSFDMPRYRRAEIEGGTFFFTIVVADRSSEILVPHIDRFRRVYSLVQERHPFRTIAICILPDHLHAIWSLPEGDADYALRWSVIKSRFSRGLDGASSRSIARPVRRRCPPYESSFQFCRGRVGNGARHCLSAWAKSLGAIAHVSTPEQAILPTLRVIISGRRRRRAPHWRRCRRG